MEQTYYLANIVGRAYKSHSARNIRCIVLHGQQRAMYTLVIEIVQRKPSFSNVLSLRVLSLP